MALSVGSVNEISQTTSKLNQNKISAPKVSSNEQKGNDSTLITTLACLGVVGLATAGVLIGLKKGKVTGKATGTQETLSNLEKMSIKDFKKIGKFDKGVASIDGKPFTGEISTPNATMIYENGKIKKSLLNDGTTKIYSDNGVKFTKNSVETVIRKDEDGTVNISKFTHLPDSSQWFETKITPDKKVTKELIKHYTIQDPHYQNGAPQAVRRITNLDTGESKLIHRTKSYNIGDESLYYREHIMHDGKKLTVNYCSGKFINATHSTYNPETGIYTNEYFMKNAEGKFEPNNLFAQVHKKTGATIVYSKAQNGDILLQDFKDGHAYPQNGSVLDIAPTATGREYIAGLAEVYNIPFAV